VSLYRISSVAILISPLLCLPSLKRPGLRGGALIISIYNSDLDRRSLEIKTENYVEFEPASYLMRRAKQDADCYKRLGFAAVKSGGTFQATFDQIRRYRAGMINVIVGINSIETL
jgi:hypothetical protein